MKIGKIYIHTVEVFKNYALKEIKTAHVKNRHNPVLSKNVKIMTVRLNFSKSF